MFAALAVVFAVGFVIFGVGSGSTGFGHLLGGNLFGHVGRHPSQVSVSDARNRIKKNPNDAGAFLQLATALQTQGRTGEAIDALERYTRLQPKDEDSLRQLAGLYLTQAGRLRNEARLAQFNAQTQLGGSSFLPPPTTPLGQGIGQDPIEQALGARVNTSVTDAYTRTQNEYGKALGAFRRVAALTPDDSSIQIQLADAAQQAGDTPTAIAAYRRFLKLAPDDPNASAVKQQIKVLQSALPGGPSG